MRLANYLLLERKGRSIEVTKEDALAFLEKNCQYFLSKKYNCDDPWIYRGASNLEKNYYIVKPSQFTRESANTDNYYTLIMDNSPLWKEYPKRSRSIVCANQSDGAYGKPYLVVPVAGSKLGICPTIDIWSSFKQTISRYMLDDINKELNYIFKETSIKEINTFADLKNACKQVTSMSKKGKLILINRFFSNYNFDKHGDFYDYLIKLYDPSKNGFEVTTVEKYTPVEYSRELWTDGDSILINVFTSNMLLKEVHLLYNL